MSTLMLSKSAPVEALRDCDRAVPAAVGTNSSVSQRRRSKPRANISGCIFEVAMEIVEEIGRLTKSRESIPTDAPLRLDATVALQLYSWVQSRYDWDGDMSRLLEADLCAETLAGDIVRTAHRSPVDGKAHLFEAELFQLESKDSVKRSVKQAPAARALSRTSSTPKRGKLAPRTDISVVVEPKPNAHADRKPSVAVPVSAARYHPEQAPLDIGMASYESWSGMKTSMIIGLLTLSSMFGSPTSATFQQSRRGHSSFGVSPAPPAYDVRSPQRPASILTPWLDVVRFQGMEPVQSPWIADKTYGTIDSVLSQFPQTPCGF